MGYPIYHGTTYVNVAARLYCEKPMRSLVAFPVAKVESGKSKYMMAHVYIHGEMGSAKQVIRSLSKAKYHRELR